jgi:hydrophobe/amphiphile efflux-3 (HAE3) family protein
MLKFINKINEYPKTILILSLLITGLFFKVMKDNARMETDLDEYMPQDHPAFLYSDMAEGWFDIKDGIIIAIENKAGIYNTETLQKIKDLTKELGKLAEIEKSDVTSLYTADNILGTEDGMDVKAFYKKVPKTTEKLSVLQNNVKTNDMVYERLVSKDEKVTVIVARINKYHVVDGDTVKVFNQEFYNRILEIGKKYEGPENVYVAGSPIVEGTMALLGPADMKRMVPIVLLVIIVVLFLVLRNIRSTIFTMLVVAFSTIWAFGLMTLVGIPIYAVSTMIPVMLIAIGVADGIHLYSHLQLFINNNPAATKKEAVNDMIKEMWKPVVMTSITTAVGFVSLLTSEVYPIKYFGLFTAFGVLSAMMFSLILIPAGILLFGMPKSKPKNNEAEASHSFSDKFSNFVIKRKTLSYVLTVLIVFISLYGMTKVWINSSFLEKFETDSDIVLTDKFINENFGGTSTLNIILEGSEDGALKDPVVLKKISKMQNKVENDLAVVGSSFSIIDYLKRMNKVMHADSAKYDVIPDSRELTAQYLLLYEMSGDPENLWQVVTEDFKKANITFQLKSDNSKALRSAMAIVEEFRTDLKDSGVEIKYAGSGYKALVFTDLILEGQIKSLVMSLLIVIILLAFMFKNFYIGLIGSIPIVITTLISFGTMGLLNIPLSTTTALISSIAIGIGIDYAVHFIERYKINALLTNDKTQTIKLTMHHSGRAIIFNAVVVIAGFLVLLFSVFPPNRALGALVSLNMFTSFLGTVTIMFIILYISNIYFKKKEK